MVRGFSRSISFPLSTGPKPAKVAGGRSTGRANSGHVRSISLPCQSHPQFTHVGELIRSVESCLSQIEASINPSVGFARIEALHIALVELLNQFAGSQQPAERVLDDVLILTDIYDSLRCAVIDFKQQQCDLRAAVRRLDDARLATSIRALRQSEKQIKKLASSLRKLSKTAPSSPAKNAEDATLTVEEAVTATAAASAAIFSRIAASSAEASSSAAALTRPSSIEKLARATALRKRRLPEHEMGMAAMAKLEECERWICELEMGTQRVFMSLVHVRVALLNIHSHLL